jgi:hypothetical protein
MTIKTSCEKCIFADYSDSDSPCAMNIFDHIKSKKTIISEINGFNSILNYRCAFAFSTEVYQEHKEEIGSIDDLKNQLVERATISYYMIILLEESQIDKVCQSLSNLIVKPKFVSFVLHQNNNTETIINKLNSLTSIIPWKLHNLLEADSSQQDILDTVLSTNTNIGQSQYLWINTADSYDTWGTSISTINRIIVLEQPTLHAMFRSGTSGLFIGVDNYNKLIRDKKTDILSAIQDLPNPLIHYYA